MAKETLEFILLVVTVFPWMVITMPLAMYKTGNIYGAWYELDILIGEG